MIRIGLCGYGYWGPNLLRSFVANRRRFQMVAVADHLPERRDAASQVSGIDILDDASALVERPDIDAVAIATPVASHYDLARRAIDHGKHVLLEKPMCATAEQAGDLVARAERAGVTLMVDHTYIFHPAVRKIAELKAEGALGHVSYFDSLRINLGLFQPDVNVLWDLAPHDFSILDFLFGEEPLHIEASGFCHVNATLPDIAYVTLHYPSKLIAHLNLSWMSPVKARRVAIGGAKRMVVWDDLERDQRVKIYDSGISVQPESRRNLLIPSYRIGDVYSPRLSGTEPLADAIEHFGAVIGGEVMPLIDGRRGLRVVSQLEAAQRALDVSISAVAEVRARASNAQPISATAS